MTNFHPITRLQKFRLLSLIPLYFMIVGLFLQPITEILPGLWTLIKEPDFLITDYSWSAASELPLSTPDC